MPHLISPTLLVLFALGFAHADSSAPVPLRAVHGHTRHPARRFKLEAAERERLATALGAFNLLSPPEQAAQLERARALGLTADRLYRGANFRDAALSYRTAADLDPNDSSYAIKYGVCLYRVNALEEAIAVLDVSTSTDPERDYYLGLAYFRSGEFDAASDRLNAVIKGDDPVMAPSARFFVGEIRSAKSKLETPGGTFRDAVQVAPNSALATQAESYLARVTGVLDDRSRPSRRLHLNAVVGLMYDSNILIAPDNVADQGSPASVHDARLLTAGDIGWSAINTDHHEFGAVLSESLINSRTNKGAPGDPFTTNLAFPYVHRGSVFTKTHRLQARPAVEFLYMDPTDTGTKSLILQSYIFSLENAFVMSADWFSTYTLEYRRNESNLLSSVGPNDLSADLYAVRSVQAVYLDQAHREALVANFGGVLNAALGPAQRYRRVEFGATYVRPLGQDLSWNFGVNAYRLTYAAAQPSRRDFNTTVSTGLSEPLGPWATWGLVLSYTRNDSNISADAYSRLLAMTTLGFSY